VASVLVNGALFVMILSYGSPKLQVTAAYILSWFLLLSGVGVVLAHDINAGDAFTLRKLTHLPRFLWSVLWLVITVAALSAGARLLT
jgi:predicted anti-sigma-YlaC factor YlaD